MKQERITRQKVFNRVAGVTIRLIEPDKQQDFRVSDLLTQELERLKKDKNIICVQYFKETI